MPGHQAGEGDGTVPGRGDDKVPAGVFEALPDVLDVAGALRIQFTQLGLELAAIATQRLDLRLQRQAAGVSWASSASLW